MECQECWSENLLQRTADQRRVTFKPEPCLEIPSSCGDEFAEGRQDYTLQRSEHARSARQEQNGKNTLHILAALREERCRQSEVLLYMCLGLRSKASSGRWFRRRRRRHRVQTQ